MESDARAVAAKPAKLKRGDITKRLILVAAAKEFAAKGYEGGSLRSIARACGIELGLIQYHFSDKITLWSAVLDMVGGELQDDINLVFARCVDRPEAELVANLIETLVRHAVADPFFVGVMSHARPESSLHSDVMRDRLGASSVRILRAIEQAQQAGAMIPGRAGVLFYQVVGASMRIFMNAADAPMLTGRSRHDAEVIDEHITMCVRLFLPDVRQGRDGGWKLEAPTSQPHLEAPPPKERPPSEVVDFDAGAPAFYLMSVANAVFHRWLGEQLPALNLTHGQAIVLIRIADEQGVSATQLARMLGVTIQTVAMFVKGLEENNLVRRSVDPASKRTRPIELTSKGAAVLEMLQPIARSAEAWALDGLSFEERAVFRKALARILRRRHPEALGG